MRNRRQLKYSTSIRMLVITIIIPLIPMAQQPDFWHKGGYGVWLGYQLRNPVTKKISWNSDVQARIRNNNTVYDYTLIRSGLQYAFTKKISAVAGLLYGRNNLEGKTLPVWKNEYRLWQDFRYNGGSLEKGMAMLQVRLEERWFVSETLSEAVNKLFAVRLRLRTEGRKALNEKWRLNAGNELMYQYAKNKTRFNQNRVWFGAGYAITPKYEIQLQAMQIIWDAPDQTVLRINIIHQL